MRILNPGGVGSSVGGSTEQLPAFKGTVANYSALPLVGNTVGDIYFTLNPQGVWGVNRKPSDYYFWTGSDWRGKANKLVSITGLTNTGPQEVLSASTGAVIQAALDGKKDDFTENTAFNKDFGTAAGTVLEGNTSLQNLYNNQSPQILVNNTKGPFIASNVGSTSPALKVGGSAAFPTTSLTNGVLHVHTDGLLYSYDSSRSKFLGVNREPIAWTDNGNNNNNYLREGNVISTTSGWPMPFDGTIVQVVANGENNLTKGLEIRSNSGGAFSSILSFSLSSGSYNDNTLNIDVDEGVQLKCFANSTLPAVSDPRVIIYVTRRGS